MKLIIDIPKQAYYHIGVMPMTSNVNNTIIKAVKDGTPLEEHCNQCKVNPCRYCEHDKHYVTWITGADGAKVALRNVPIDKANKICDILGDSYSEIPNKSVLDKIKAELHNAYGATGWIDDKLDSVIDIIDKYTAQEGESE